MHVALYLSLSPASTHKHILTHCHIHTYIEDSCYFLYPFTAWLLQLSPNGYTWFCHPASPENSELCCKTCSLGIPSTPLLEKLHWHPISERIKYKAACMCFSAINGSGLAYLSELLHVYTPSRALRSRGFRTFSCFGPHIWNSLPQDLRHCSTLSSFKTKLKTFLFSQSFRPN